MHARGRGEAARRAKRGRQPLPSRAISHARGHLCVSRFARRTTEKRETARSRYCKRNSFINLWLDLIPRIRVQLIYSLLDHSHLEPD